MVNYIKIQSVIKNKYTMLKYRKLCKIKKNIIFWAIKKYNLIMGKL